MKEKFKNLFTKIILLIKVLGWVSFVLSLYSLEYLASFMNLFFTISIVA